MPWKIHPNGARELVRPTKFERHLMLYPSGGIPARAVISFKSYSTQVVKVESSPAAQVVKKSSSKNQG